MSTSKSVPVNNENTTGHLTANVSNRGFFETRDLTTLATEVQCAFTGIAQRGAQQSLRIIEIRVDADIEPGTYEFGSTGTGPVRHVIYSEMRRQGLTRYLDTAITEKGSLTLSIENNNQLYKGTFSLTAKTKSGLDINITDGNFEFYIPTVATD